MKAYLALQSHGEINVNPLLNTPPLMKEIVDYYKNNFIAVYPDVIRGNPLNAKHVVRMLLAPRGKYGGDAEFPETDMVYGALPSIADKVLRIPVSDTSTFYPPPIDRRIGSCFYSHKYDSIHGRELLPITDGMTRLEGSLDELANILCKSDMCYLYELTSVITEAGLCGCPVTLIRSEYFNEIDPACLMGNVKWSDGEIVKETNNFNTEYQKTVDGFWDQLREFIKETQA